jgi:NAD(P)-dependent dehydrogenase (short-subunit alcohol dehydrogenase family)
MKVILVDQVVCIATEGKMVSSFSRFAPTASIVVLGGIARDWPYRRSTTLTIANGAVSSMVRTLAVELAPVRVNAIHPGAAWRVQQW